MSGQKEKEYKEGKLYGRVDTVANLGLVAWYNKSQINNVLEINNLKYKTPDQLAEKIGPHAVALLKSLRKKSDFVTNLRFEVVRNNEGSVNLWLAFEVKNPYLLNKEKKMGDADADSILASHVQRPEDYVVIATATVRDLGLFGMFTLNEVDFLKDTTKKLEWKIHG